MADVYEQLGVPTVVNAAATFTAIGGALMPPEVLDAMRAAAAHNVDMHELHRAAGRRIAELTRNEAAYVTGGCAAGIVLAILAARNGGDPQVITDWPGHHEARHEVIMHAAHRIPYDPAVMLAGGVIRQIGDMFQTFPWQLEGAINDRTAAVLYVAGTHVPQTALPLEVVCDIAHRHGVPVIVDAAAQLPPADNLWRFTRECAADVAVFSGGKGLRGPQSSGLMVGSSAFIEAARQNGAPYQRWARALKVGKEEIVGLTAAVERFVTMDHAAMRRRSQADCEAWVTALAGLEGVDATIEATNEAGQSLPRVHVTVSPPADAARMTAFFDAASPRLAVYPDAPLGVVRGFWITPELVERQCLGYVVETIRHAHAASTG